MTCLGICLACMNGRHEECVGNIPAPSGMDGPAFQCVCPCQKNLKEDSEGD